MLCDQCFQRAFALLFSAPQHLVEVDDDRIAERSIEAAQQLFALCDRFIVLAKQTAKSASHNTFASTGFAVHHDRGFTRTLRMLHSIGHPSNDVIEQFFSAATYNIADMVLQQRPIPRLRFDAKATPKVQLARGIRRTVRFEDETGVEIFSPFTPFFPGPRKQLWLANIRMTLV